VVTKVQRWGNSLGLRIPRALAADADVSEGTPVRLVVDNGRLLVSRVEPAAFDLAELLSRVTKRNLHAAVKTGPAVGKESW